MPEISLSTQKLIQQYQSWHQSLQAKEGINVIQVDEVASRVAVFYEKIRGVIDWREEHLLRKTAIERILKRRIFLKKSDEKIALSLVYEIIRSGHFPNNTIPEAQIIKVQKLIDKHVFIIENAPSSPAGKEKFQLYGWILSIAACEIEETLSPPLKERALMDYMTELMNEKIEIKKESFIKKNLEGIKKNTQIYIAVQRALFRLDSPIISYHLLKKKYPNWPNLSSLELHEITENIYTIQENIENDLAHPLGHKFYKFCEKYDTPYLLLGDILSEGPTSIQEKIHQPEVMENLIQRAYNKRAKTLKSRINRAAIYVTLSIFFTNMVALHIIEIPFTIHIMGEPFGIFPRLISILIPTLLMFFLVATVKLPRKENLQMVVMETMKIIYQNKKREIYEIKNPPPRGFILKIINGFLYLLSFCVSYGLIIWGLILLQIPIATQATFLVFISLIAFAGIKLREKSKELQIIEDEEKFFHFIGDLFSMPIAQIGKKMSGWWAKNNTIAVFFAALIDMPFQLFIEFLEQWRYFLKEKKEKLH